MAGNKVRDKDRGYKKVRRNVTKAASGKSLTVGVLEEDKGGEGHGGSEEGLTVSQIATEHEFGLGVPERSFIRAWFDAQKNQIDQDLSKMMRQVIQGRYDLDRGLNILGVKYVGEIQQKIPAGIPPPNSDRTIARKGSSTPLIDTGQLRSAITYLIKQRLND
jgi:hypothetical protein